MDIIKKNIIFDYIKSIFIVLILFIVIYINYSSTFDYVLAFITMIVVSLRQIYYYVLINNAEKTMCKSKIVFYIYSRIIITNSEVFLPKYNKIINRNEIVSCYINSSFLKSIIINTKTKKYIIKVYHLFKKWYPFDLLNGENSQNKLIVDILKDGSEK